MDRLISEKQVLDAIAVFIKNNDSVAKLILNINAIPSADNWIPVSERLPDIGQRVLVTYNQEDKLKVDTTIFDKHGFLIGIVTAWMPLPKPYEPQERSE